MDFKNIYKFIIKVTIFYIFDDLEFEKNIYVYKISNKKPSIEKQNNIYSNKDLFLIL